MTVYEVLFLILIVAFVVFIFGREVYLKIKHKPSGECRYCHSNSKKLSNNVISFSPKLIKNHLNTYILIYL